MLTRRLAASTLGFVALTMMARHRLAGQATPASVGSVIGTVRDATGRPIADAIVYLTELRREARTRADGMFRLEIRAPASYTIGARALGYRGVSQRLRLDTGVTRVAFELERLPEFLKSVVTTATRGGLSGVVLDDAGNPLANADVRALGAGVGGTRTDSLGEFFVPVKSGRLLVRVDKPGYRRHLVSVTVPPGDGRRMTASLSVQVEKPSPMEGTNLFDLQQRLVRANPVWQRLVTREDLLKFGDQNAQQVAGRFAAQPMSDEECAKLDGGPAEAPLWTIDVQEIEFMETTAAPPPRIPRVPTQCRHVVWLRR